MYVELLVGNESGTKVYQPVVQEGIEWSTERKNTPGKLVFKVLYDNILDFSEGSPVRMKVDGVEKCKHTYKEGEHWMDLTLRGGEFIA